MSNKLPGVRIELVQNLHLRVFIAARVWQSSDKAPVSKIVNLVPLRLVRTKLTLIALTKQLWVDVPDRGYSRRGGLLSVGVAAQPATHKNFLILPGKCV